MGNITNVAEAEDWRQSQVSVKSVIRDLKNDRKTDRNCEMDLIDAWAGGGEGPKKKPSLCPPRLDQTRNTNKQGILCKRPCMQRPENTTHNNVSNKHARPRCWT